MSKIKNKKNTNSRSLFEKDNTSLSKLKEVISKSDDITEEQISSLIKENNITKKQEYESLFQEILQNEVFDAYKIADLVLKHEEIYNDKKWLYVVEQDVFYCYESGVWNKNNVFYLKETVKELLRKIRISWNKTYRVNEVLENIKSLVSFKENNEIFKEINQTKRFINVKNGMYDINNRKLLPHDPDYHSIFQLAVKYDEKASCKKWKKSLKEWLPDKTTRKFLQEFIGYLLIPDKSAQKFVILYGKGANGKGVFLSIIQELLGDNISFLNLSNFTGTQARWAPAQLQNKLANICSDIDPVYLKRPGLLKTITGDDGKIVAERKHKPQFQFDPVTRFIFSANELPSVNDKSQAWLRRMEIVEFPNNFHPTDDDFDPHLKEKLINELPGILNWALKGLFRLKNNNMKFTISSKMREMKNFYRKENSNLKYFIDKNIKITNNDEDFVKTDYVYSKYKNWAKNTGYKIKSKTSLTKYLKKKNVVCKNKTVDNVTSRYYFRIKI